MIHDESIQTRLLLKQNAMRAGRTGIPVTGRIIRAQERSDAEELASGQHVAVSFWGGWDDAQRVQVCFHDYGDQPIFSGVWLQIKWNAKYSSVSHSDLLGSLMALGIDRSFAGDILLREQNALLWALPEIACRLPQEWTKAGRAPIQVHILDTVPQIEAPQGKTIKDTVSSMRLDCILASGMCVSRSKAAEAISTGLVMVDHHLQLRADRQLTENQIVSVRHFGRIRVNQIGGFTRKDRLNVMLEIFTAS